MKARRVEDVKKSLLIGSCALALAALNACGGGDNANSTNANANMNTANTSGANTTSSTTTTTTNTSDASEITRTEENGAVTQTRTFKSGRVEKVVVTTREGKRTARVYARDTGEIRALPEDKIDTALNATGDAIASAAGFVADKAGDVGHATVEGGRTVIDKTAEGAKTAGQKTAEGAKAVGGATAEGAKTVGDKTVEGAKKVGSAVKNAVKH
jgi:hypothetical protein